MDSIENIILRQGLESARRQSQLRKMLYVTWIAGFVGIFVMGSILLNLNSSNADLSANIKSRTPVMNYIKCHDHREDARNKAHTEYVIAAVTIFYNAEGEPLNKVEQRTLSNYQLTYQRTEDELTASTGDGPDSCPGP